jgi:hypothetical protein
LFFDELQYGEAIVLGYNRESILGGGQLAHTKLFNSSTVGSRHVPPSSRLAMRAACSASSRVNIRAVPIQVTPFQV